MKPDLVALLEIVDGATSGPWHKDGFHGMPSEGFVWLTRARRVDAGSHEDARFIATFDPALLRDLLTRMQDLEKELAECKRLKSASG